MIYLHVYRSTVYLICHMMLRAYDVWIYTWVIKRFQITLESFIVFLVSVLSLILFFHASGSSFARVNLQNRNTFSHQTSHTCEPLPLVMHLIFIEPIQITILDLELNPYLQIFLYIYETYYSIFNFNTFTRRSQLGQHFTFFELRALVNLWGRYGSKTSLFTVSCL